MTHFFTAQTDPTVNGPHGEGYDPSEWLLHALISSQILLLLNGVFANV